MAIRQKRWVGSAITKSQVWGLVPPVTPSAPTWSLTINGKTLSVLSNGTASDAVNQMLTEISGSTEPEWQEISASAPTSTNTNPQGIGTNEIQAIWISGSPTGGSFQIGTTPFVDDPKTAPQVADSGSSGSPNGSYRYTFTYLSYNALGQLAETNPSPEATVSVTSHSINVTVPDPPEPGVVGMRIYRTAAGGSSGTEKLVWTLWGLGVTTYTDNIADGSLGANQPTQNLTGIPYNATAVQMAALFQELFGAGNINVVGSGTPSSPWLIQWCGSLAAKQSALLKTGKQSFSYATTVPASPFPQANISEVQQGIPANAVPPSDGNTLLLVGQPSVPFYVTSLVTGVIQPSCTLNNVTPPPPPSNSQLFISPVAPTINVSRVVKGQVPQNELQLVTISPNAEAGSTFTLSFNGHTTNAIPIPPVCGTPSLNGVGVLSGKYFYCATWITATGETEASGPSIQISATTNQIQIAEPASAPTAVTQFRIYRTKANGLITGPYWLVTTQTKGSGAFSDNNSDATIEANPQVPTTNGVLQGELESLSSVGVGNVQVSGSNFAAYSGMLLQAPFPQLPPVANSSQLASAPAVTGIVPSASGGSLTTGAYFYQVTAVDPFGETLPGSEGSVTIKGSTGRAVITWGAISNATGYRIYRGTLSDEENVLIGTSAAGVTSFIDSGMTPSPIVYAVEFIGDLASAPQPQMLGNASSVSILPGITLTETQPGNPIQDEIQVVGWTQLLGNANPMGSFQLSFPDLQFTSGSIAWNATASAVLENIQLGAPPQFVQSFSVTQITSTNSAALFAITYQGNLALKEMALVKVLSALTPAAGDTITPYARRFQAGSPVGRNEILTATLDNNPTGGTFGLTATLAGGTTISASSVAYNASAATLQAAFPAATMSVSGSAGGPYTLEAIGEAGSQKVTWTATSSLTAPGGQAGSPPTVNTAGINYPTITTATGTTGGALATGTYYYKVTALGIGGGETNSPEYAIAVTGPMGYAQMSWSAVTGANSYKVYRGATPGGENVEIFAGNTLEYIDFGGTNVSQTPPGSNTAEIPPPVQEPLSNYGALGQLTGGTTYYYVVTAVVGSETIASNEQSISVSGSGNVGAVEVTWLSIPGATAYNIYRGTSSGSEGTLVGTTAGSSSGIYVNGLTFVDSGPTNASASPPGSNTAVISVPVISVSSGGNGVLSVPAFYKLTAFNGAGQTTASNEVTNSSSASLLTWTPIPGATGYKLYYGTSTGAENKLIATINGGNASSFLDSGLLAASASPPGSGGTAPTAPALVAELGEGAFAASTYYYKITASTGGGETLPSSEVSITIPTLSAVFIQIPAQTIAGFTGWNVYRGTSPGGENVRILTNGAGGSPGSTVDLIDSNETNTSASPPGSNTATLPAPTSSACTVSQTLGELAAGTYYYKISATDGAGETTGSAEQSGTITSAIGSITVNWAALNGATGYNVYKGTASNSENVKLATLPASQTSFLDAGGTTTTQSPPGSGATLPAPIQTAVTGPTLGGNGGGISWYVVTAFNQNGETTASNEEEGFPAGGEYLTINWQTVPGAIGYKIYRGTTSGAESILVGTVNSSSATSFDDGFPPNISATPPTRNTALIAPPIQGSPNPLSSGGFMQTGTYYYVVTALTGNGETTASNEQAASVTGPTGEVQLQWVLVPGATGYKIYRGTVAGAENSLITIISSGSTITYTDTTGSNSGLSLLVTAPVTGLAPLNEVQEIVISNAGGGTFDVVYQNNSTGQIPWNVTAANLQFVLTAQPLLGANNLQVASATVGATTTYTLTYVGDQGSRPQPLIAAYGAGITAFTAFPPTVNLTGQSPPSDLTQTGNISGLLSAPRYYVVTALFPNGETTPSNEILGTNTANESGVQLTWNRVPGAISYNIYTSAFTGAGGSPGSEELLVANVLDSSFQPGATGQFNDNGTEAYSPLKGGAVYTASVTGLDSFTLSFAGQTTASIAHNASALTVRQDLGALSTIGFANVVVSGSNAWTIAFAQSLIGTGILTGAIVGQSGSAGAPNPTYALQIQSATGGTFTLTYDVPVTLAYNATPGQIQTALATTAIGSGNVSVTGSGSGASGGPGNNNWVITITPTPQNVGFALTANGSALLGANANISVYPLVYCSSTGPNWFDVGGNWNDGTVPSLYLSPPAAAAILTATNASLLANTHGSLTVGQTYYYVVTALNANGETVGSNEVSATPFAGALLYVNGTLTAGNFTLSYGGQTTGNIAYTAGSSGIASALNALSSINANGGSCIVTGSGTQISPFVFTLGGSLLGTAPTSLTANSSGLTGGTISVLNSDTRSIALSWNEVPGATGYNVYRGTTASGENVVVAGLTSRDQTLFIDDGTYTTISQSPPSGSPSYHTAVGDNVNATASSVSILYGIGNSIVNGYSVHGGFRGLNYGQVNALTIDATFTGTIGLPRENPLGYAEYRPCDLQIMGPPSGVFTITIGNGGNNALGGNSGSGSALISLDTGTCQIAGVCNYLATPTNSPAALLWIGTNSASEWDLFYGTAAFGIYPEQTFSIGTIRQAFQTQEGTDTALELGAGGTVTTVLKEGGATLIHCSIGTLTGTAGTVTQDSGSVTTMTLANCNYVSRSIGEITTLTVSANGVFDRSQDSRPLQVATATVYGGATYNDPNGATYNSVQGTMLVSCPQCGLQPGDPSGAWVDLGRRITVQRVDL